MKKYLVLLLLAGASTASAQQLSMSDKLALRNACQADMQALCPGVKPGGGGLLACMQDKKAELSEGCAKALTSVKAKMEN